MKSMTFRDDDEKIITLFKTHGIIDFDSFKSVEIIYTVRRDQFVFLRRHLPETHFEQP